MSLHIASLAGHPCTRKNIHWLTSQKAAAIVVHCTETICSMCSQHPILDWYMAVNVQQGTWAFNCSKTIVYLGDSLFSTSSQCAEAS